MNNKNNNRKHETLTPTIGSGWVRVYHAYDYNYNNNRSNSNNNTSNNNNNATDSLRCHDNSFDELLFESTAPVDVAAVRAVVAGCLGVMPMDAYENSNRRERYRHLYVDGPLQAGRYVAVFANTKTSTIQR